ncbi:MAG: class I SAM-dependent methyltransferase [Planctomycetes bacterium]|nr:class I SAM-dependent methyltransferase [Planctomycetota bacterium]MBU1518501.1 class I SAM-dependent methyltransferase [Planctomycetota bacterium]MBU2457969.1 class I SAM-dependent methyltransferase [Planctomycetota bacterium]MBU2597314.1 class I SAM-dependent methyltransferase [Planctomycetota bacterium]
MNKKEFYEKRAESYTKFDKQGFTRYSRALKLVNIQNGAKILDVGCKHAFLCDFLAKKGIDCDYNGLDISEKVIENLKHKKGSFQVCDVMKGLPFEDNKFDYIFCFELIEHVENPTFLLNQFKRILKDNGVLLLSAPNPYNWIYLLVELLKSPDTEGHIHSFTRQNMGRVADFCGFNIEKRLGTYAILPYTLHGIRTGNYLMFPSSSAFLATSYIYKLGKCPVNA